MFQVQPTYEMWECRTRNLLRRLHDASGDDFGLEGCGMHGRTHALDGASYHHLL